MSIWVSVMKATSCFKKDFICFVSVRSIQAPVITRLSMPKQSNSLLIRKPLDDVNNAWNMQKVFCLFGHVPVSLSFIVFHYFHNGWNGIRTFNIFYRTSFSYNFGSFRNKQYNFYRKLIWKYPTSIWCWYANSRPIDQESPHITTRPRLPPELKHFDWLLFFSSVLYVGTVDNC